jgi:hypothetical protein
MAKVSEMPNDELVNIYVQLRDRRTVRKKEFEMVDNKDKEKLEKIEAVLLQRYQEAGIESARTQYGTAYKTTVAYASVADKDAFFNHVKEKEAYELLDVRCNKTGVQQYIDEHDDLPPGINWREEVHIRVQRA